MLALTFKWTHCIIMTHSFSQLPRMHMVGKHNEHCFITLFPKWKGLVPLLLKTYGLIEELTTLAPASSQSQGFWTRNRTPLGSEKAGRKWGTERERGATGAIACPLTAPSVTGLSDSLMRFKMTGTRTPCRGKGEVFLVLKIDGGRLQGVAAGRVWISSMGGTWGAFKAPMTLQF